MRWFGPTWDAPVNESTKQMETPEDEDCAGCGELILPGQQGVELPYVPSNLQPVPIYYHLQCFLWEIGFPSATHLPGVHDQPPAESADGGG